MELLRISREKPKPVLMAISVFKTDLAVGALCFFDLDSNRDCLCPNLTSCNPSVLSVRNRKVKAGEVFSARLDCRMSETARHDCPTID